jgi:hypothetical protein
MADEPIDAGLEELISDQLGPAADAPPEGGAEQPTQETEAQPTEEVQPPDASAEAPTPPEQATFEFNGRRYTKDELQAALQTREQFPHLQQKYLELKRAEEARLASQSQQPPAQAPRDPARLRANLRASFDPEVKQAVADGLLEADFAELYPDLSAALMLHRDSLTAVANVVNTMNAKIQAYEQQMVGERITSDVKNNMVALSGQHPALAPLSDPTVRDQFWGYLVQLDPKIGQLQDPEYMIGAWVAYRRNEFLSAPAAAPVVEAARVEQRRRAKADALPGSRPASGPVEPMTALDEMAEEIRTGKVARR